MRKLLIKLVAIETALVGWLSYWLFLVYANNPSVAAELSSSLQRFPQTSFSTIDIAVMVIIAALAVTLAFRFQRGLRPGIRLERALQMLENLMKRNLILEAQVAELKIEKSHAPPPTILSTPSPPPQNVEPRQGSWEKAFRTPLEAGTQNSMGTATAGSDSIPFSRETGIPPPRIEPKLQTGPITIQPPILVTEKVPESSPPPTILADKPSFQNTPKSSAVWEDSPQMIGESKGILTPSSSPRKAPPVSDTGGLKQPYIPAPAPKAPPPSAIAGPMPQIAPAKITTSPSTRILARPTARPSTPKSSLTIGITNPQPTSGSTDETVLPSPTPGSNSATTKPSSTADALLGIEALSARLTDPVGSTDEKTSSKPVQPTRKRTLSDGT
jgi:hypothetical protein